MSIIVILSLITLYYYLRISYSEFITLGYEIFLGFNKATMKYFSPLNAELEGRLAWK